MKIKILIALLAIITIFAQLQADWNLQFTGSQNLNAIEFPPNNTNIGFACGDNSYYLKTIDGGAHWDSLLIISSGNFHDINFPVDEMTGYIACDEGNVLKTTDGGEVWELINTGSPFNFKAIHFPNNNDTGYVVGDDGTAKVTRDGGLSWEDIPPPIPTFYNSVYFINGLEGWVVGNEGFVFHTSNGGLVWEEQTTGLNEHFLDIFFVDELKGWIAGDNNTCLKTSNGGQDWDRLYVPFPVGGTVHSVLFPVDNNTGFIGGTAGYIARTTDSGTSWDFASLNPEFDIKSIEFPGDNQTGWLCGSLGLIYNTTDGGGVWVEEKYPQKEIMVRFNCAPNPFHQTTVIQVPSSIAREYESNINIYDISGKLVKSLPASSRLVWDGRNENCQRVSPGVYFIELNKNNGSTRRLKVVLSD